MRKFLLIVLCLILCFPVSGCSETRQERQDRERELADDAYRDGYDDGYRDGYEDGYRDGLSAGPSQATRASSSYVLNTRSRVFHLPACSSVEDMNDDNKKFYSGSREEVIDMGYKPCGRCNP